MKGHQAFVRSQYDTTQAYLKKNGIEKVFLWRGMVSNERTELHPIRPGRKDVSMRPISSFTLDHYRALEFADSEIEDFKYKIVMGASVPRERIFSLPVTGIGCKEETEVIVLGGETKVWFNSVKSEFRPPKESRLVEEMVRYERMRREREERRRRRESGGYY